MQTYGQIASAIRATNDLIAKRQAYAIGIGFISGALSGGVTGEALPPEDDLGDVATADDDACDEFADRFETWAELCDWPEPE